MTDSGKPTKIAVSQLRSLIEACLATKADGSIHCDIVLEAHTKKEKSLSDKFDPSVWRDNESINFVQKLGETGALWSRNFNQPPQNQADNAERNHEPPEPPPENQERDTTKINEWGDTFARPEGSWRCSVCNLWNKDELLKCVSCETLNLSARVRHRRPPCRQSQPDSSKFSFGYNAPSAGAQAAAPTTSQPGSSNLSFGYTAPSTVAQAAVSTTSQPVSFGYAALATVPVNTQAAAQPTSSVLSPGISAPRPSTLAAPSMNPTDTDADHTIPSIKTPAVKPSTNTAIKQKGGRTMELLGTHWRFTHPKKKYQRKWAKEKMKSPWSFVKMGICSIPFATARSSMARSLSELAKKSTGALLVARQKIAA